MQNIGDMFKYVRDVLSTPRLTGCVYACECMLVCADPLCFWSGSHLAWHQDGAAVHKLNEDEDVRHHGRRAGALTCTHKPTLSCTLACERCGGQCHGGSSRSVWDTLWRIGCKVRGCAHASAGSVSAQQRAWILQRLPTRLLLELKECRSLDCGEPTTFFRKWRYRIQHALLGTCSI